MKKSIFAMLLGAVAFFFSSAFATSASSEEYLYFSPQAIESHLKGYTEDEKAAIQKDLKVVRSVCLPSSSVAHRKPLYLATAGGPGARKTTILERYMKEHSLLSKITYIDPDQRALKFMVHTYYSQSLSALIIGNYPDYAVAVKNAYDKWRGGSNFIALTLLEEAFAQRKDVAYGTTSTGDHISKFLINVKNAGYDITLLLCSCEDSFRQNSIQYRNEMQKFYQSSPEDALNKGKLFPLRMSDYFTYADILYLYWSDDLTSQERLAAILKNGKLEVRDMQALNQFVRKFEKDRETLNAEGNQILSWDELMNIYRNRF